MVRNKNIADVSATVVHEATHFEINSKINTIKEETYCRCKEHLHLHDDKITVSDIKRIIRKTKNDYSGMEWKNEQGFNLRKKQ